jgi:uncharacterized protein YgbK (DUF1537 family)
MGAGIVFLGDDFTGASDSLATYAGRGLATRLVTGRAAPAAGLDVLGIATDLRSLSPERAEEVVDRLWPMIECEAPGRLHLKVCSTFDSAPLVGSIGAVANALIARFEPDVTAVIGGQPSLGRHCAFGTLFARGPDGMVHRIDRHPVMANHPVTPMTEADLGRHLGAQGLVLSERITLADLPDPDNVATRLRKAPALVDVTTAEDQARIRAALDIAGGRQLLVGASSVAEILGGPPTRRAPVLPPTRPGGLLVFAGSRSSVTADQVARAASLEPLALTPARLGDPATIDRVAARLDREAPLLVHLEPGADYGRSPDRLADDCAAFVTAVARQVPLRALGLAGGDSSSRIVARMGFDALDFLADLGQGACVCLGRHADPAQDGMPVMLKGGQMGSADLFDRFAARF